MTEEELLTEKAKTEGARISYTWLKRHLADFDRSEESAKKIGDYLKAHELSFTEENLEKAFADLKAQGVKFTAAPAAPAAPVEEPLPEVPPVVPQVNTIADIKKVPQADYHKAWFGPHQKKFRARVNEILRRGK